MRIDLKQLKKLSVETQSGQSLGMVKNVIIDIESQMIVQYEAGHMVGKSVLFNREQVVKITSDKMIVEDSVVKETRANPLSAVSSSPDPAMMMEELSS